MCGFYIFDSYVCVLPKPDFKITLEWRHNGRDNVSNHQPHDCILNRLFRRRSKKTSKLRVIGLCAGIHRGPVNSTHKWPVTRKMFPFDDVIMNETGMFSEPVRDYQKLSMMDILKIRLMDLVEAFG